MLCLEPYYNTVNGSADKMEILLKVLKDLSCLREQVERDSPRRRSVLWREVIYCRTSICVVLLYCMCTYVRWKSLAAALQMFLSFPVISKKKMEKHCDFSLLLNLIMPAKSCFWPFLMGWNCFLLILFSTCIHYHSSVWGQ